MKDRLSKIFNINILYHTLYDIRDPYYAMLQNIQILRLYHLYLLFNYSRLCMHYILYYICCFYKCFIFWNPKRKCENWTEKVMSYVDVCWYRFVTKHRIITINHCWTFSNGGDSTKVKVDRKKGISNLLLFVTESVCVFLYVPKPIM